jgi:Sec-independent protein translocase protein TatA
MIDDWGLFEWLVIILLIVIFLGLRKINKVKT